MTSVFERYSNESIRVFLFADEESCKHGYNFIGTEHLLIGILRQDTVAARALWCLGVTLAEVRKRVDDLLKDVPPMNAVSRGFTARVKRTIELSVNEADQLASATVEPEHLLLALICEGQGVASHVLEEIGINLAHIRPCVHDQLEQGGSKENSQ